jgi:hypothetical protein
MSMTGIGFPAYRKYSNGESYFHLPDEHLIVEVKKLGQRWLSYNIPVATYSDRLLQADLLNCAGGSIVNAERDEFEDILSKVLKNNEM